MMFTFQNVLNFKLNATDEYKYEATYIIYKIFQKQKETQNQVTTIITSYSPFFFKQFFY